MSTSVEYNEFRERVKLSAAFDPSGAGWTRAASEEVAWLQKELDAARLEIARYRAVESELSWLQAKALRDIDAARRCIELETINGQLEAKIHELEEDLCWRLGDRGSYFDDGGSDDGGCVDDDGNVGDIYDYWDYDYCCGGDCASANYESNRCGTNGDDGEMRF